MSDNRSERRKLAAAATEATEAAARAHRCRRIIDKTMTKSTPRNESNSMNSLSNSPISAPIPLKKRQSLSNFATTNISKHFALNNQILAAFDSLYDQKLYHVAYAVGMQFVEMALLEIPKHGYFYCLRHELERDENAKGALRVSQLLQQMLHEELDQLQTKERENDKIQKLISLAQEQSSSKQQEQLEQDRATLEEELNSMGTRFCGHTLAEYADIFNVTLFPSGTKPSSLFQPPLQRVSTRNLHDTVRSSNDIIECSPTASPHAFYTMERQASDLAVHPPLLTPHFETSSSNWSRLDSDDHSLLGDVRTTSSLSRQTSSLELERALWLSGLEIQSSFDASTPVNQQRPISQSVIDIETLGSIYFEDFNTLRSQNRVRVSRIKTYQGRLPGSINGCTVIAPLLCIHHFHNSWDNGPDMGLPDEMIVQVIDEVTPVILPEVRKQLDLTKDALIIPSDVHDYLINRSLLSPTQFVTVSGGNILDAAHVDNFVQQLKSTNGRGERLEGKKIAATLFFHEHVLTIHKLVRGKDEAWYDWVDSLPAQVTLQEPYQIDDPAYVPFAARVRCVDEEALKALIQWYACSKFTDENRRFINMYAWEDHEVDFDPRVFQAFIWAEM